MDQVSHDAGVSKMTVYRHWPSRAELLVATFRELVDDPTGPVYDPDCDPLDALRATIIEYGRQYREAPWAGAMSALLEQASHDPSLEAITIEFAHARRRQLHRVLNAAIDRGLLRDGFDLDVAVSQLVGPLAFRHLVSHEPLTDRICATIVDDFITARRPTG